MTTGNLKCEQYWSAHWDTVRGRLGKRTFHIDMGEELNRLDSENYYLRKERNDFKLVTAKALQQLEVERKARQLMEEAFIHLVHKREIEKAEMEEMKLQSQQQVRQALEGGTTKALQELEDERKARTQLVQDREIESKGRKK